MLEGLDLLRSYEFLRKRLVLQPSSNHPEM
jgi:hypothetical protein